MKQLKLVLLSTLVLISGYRCSKDSGISPEENTRDPEVIRMEYLGHSSFIMTFGDTLTIVTDPFGNSIPQFYTTPDSVEADYVTISHQHADHISMKGMIGDPTIFQKADTTYQLGDISIRGYLSAHGDWNGSNMGTNIIFVFQTPTIKLVHMGENGPLEDETILNAISDADVLIVPTGETASLSFEEIHALVQTTRARTIIPSHYSLSATKRYYGSSTVEEFVESLPEGTVVNQGDDLDIMQDMPEQVILLNPKYAKDSNVTT